MKTFSHLDRFHVVLTHPRNPLNIGAAARSMANFGFRRLSVVAPFEGAWREACSAVGAEDLLREAHCTETLAEALASSALVIGTGTLTYRKAEQTALSLPDLPAFLEASLPKSTGEVALVFGSEKHGLTRDDLALCHCLVEIPTDPRQPSMNLGQAVAVTLYEVAMRLAHAERLSSTAPARASTQRLELLAELVDQTLAAAEYSPQSMRRANLHDLRLMLRRLSLSEHDVRRLLGAFRRILWRLERGAKKDPSVT